LEQKKKIGSVTLYSYFASLICYLLDLAICLHCQEEIQFAKKKCILPRKDKGLSRFPMVELRFPPIHATLLCGVKWGY
jgi:hypothetical protein